MDLLSWRRTSFTPCVEAELYMWQLGFLRGDTLSMQLQLQLPLELLQMRVHVQVKVSNTAPHRKKTKQVCLDDTQPL